jgi:hypothetical protein
MNRFALIPLPLHLLGLLARLLGRVAGSLLTPALAGASIVAVAAWAATCLALTFTAPAHAQGQGQGQSTGPTSTGTAAPAPARAGVSPAAGAGARVALADPTRPPGTALAASTASTASTAAAARAPATARVIDGAQRPAPPAALRLQSLHLPQVGTASALIDGQLLRVGDNLREWTVQAIRTDGVLLARRPSTPTSSRAGTASRTVGHGPASASASAVPPSIAAIATTSSTTATASASTLWLSLLPALAADATSSP